MEFIISIICSVVAYGIGCLIYLKCNNGMAGNARGQQLRRIFFATVLSFLPLVISRCSITEPSIILSVVVALSWMITYPLLFHLTNRKTSPDYENYMDIVFGLYVFGGLSGINIFSAYLLPGSVVVASLVSLAEFVLLFIPLVQIVYYVLYKVCMDSDGMKILQETHLNEIIEFSKSFSLWQNLAMALPIVVLAVGCFFVNIHFPIASYGSVSTIIAVAALTVFLTVYTWKRHHGVFVRTGILTLFSVVKEYVENNHLYAKETEQRLKELMVEQMGGTTSKPSTIIMVIGESACRDYMSAFHEEMAQDTTPWMRKCLADDRHFMIFPNAYSCAMQTVPTLEKALTEYNLYNDKVFYKSCSLVDVAHKLGYKVHWYSNQGHLGSFDTPITLVADTSDVAKWTKQELNKVQYDESLIDFLDEIDPEKNNFVVLHLKGSHFNFMNRYPESFTQWGEKGVQDNVVNYKNSIFYTDYVLSKFFEYGKEKLNMQAMLYFSDHATEPGRRRKPNFDGFQMTRIPMFAYFADEYIQLHGDRYEAMKANREKYFTNDLVYDLMCGIFDVQSNHFEESNSLASPSYRYTRDMLLTYEGKKHIDEDDEIIDFDK